MFWRIKFRECSIWKFDTFLWKYALPTSCLVNTSCKLQTPEELFSLCFSGSSRADSGLATLYLEQKTTSTKKSKIITEIFLQKYYYHFRSFLYFREIKSKRKICRQLWSKYSENFSIWCSYPLLWNDTLKSCYHDNWIS